MSKDQIDKVVSTAETDVNPESETPTVEVANESFAALFDGEDLSEGFKENITTVFEAAVAERVVAESAVFKAELEESAETLINETIETRVAEITEGLDTYLDHVVGEWMAENKVAVESGIKSEISESLLEGLKDLLAEHNINITEEEVDAVAELEEQLATATSRTNDAINESIELKQSIKEMKAEIALNKICEGLTDTQADRMRTLAESIDVSNVDNYTDKLTTIKETFFDESNKIIKEDVAVLEDAPINVQEDINQPASPDSGINGYLSYFATNK